VPVRSIGRIVGGFAGQSGVNESCVCTKRDDGLDYCDDLSRHGDLGFRRLSDSLSQLQELSERYLISVGCKGCDVDAAKLSSLYEP
jgi:hypothetical protein